MIFNKIMNQLNKIMFLIIKNYNKIFKIQINLKKYNYNKIIQMKFIIIIHKINLFNKINRLFNNKFKIQINLKN